MEISLCKLTRQSHPCVIVGDMNIDLLQWDCQTAIHDYLNTVTSNNFVPSLVLPTRVTSKASTLIDHIYYYEGKSHNRLKSRSGNLVSDISDHLPNYLLLFADKTTVNYDRSVVRLFSEKARDNFSHKLNLCDWSDIYAVKDVNRASEIFFDRIATQFNESFPHVRLSRKRARDKKWITKGLKKASRTKCKLYKSWLKKRTPEAESNYKEYKKNI